MPTVVVRSKKSATEEVSGLRGQERFWLIGASLVLALGLLLTYRAKTDHFDTVHEELAAGTVVNVNAMESADALLPLLTRHYADPTDRRYVADEIMAYLRRRGSVPNVGALNTIRVHPDSAALHGGAEFQARAASVSEGTRLTLLAGTFAQLKPKLLARTPSSFNKQFWLLTLIFFGLFWGIHFVWTYRDFRGDALLLPVVLLLLGLSFIFMLSLPDPLRDYLRMQRVILGGSAGCILLGVVSLLDVQKLGRAWSYSTKSFIWLALAAALSVALITMGSGPEGSSAKVNLWIFQPVELIKACLLLFFAGYFARNWRFLRELKQDTGSRKLRRLDLAVPRLKYAWPIIFGVAMALGFFVLQKDLGPALVICTTFLILYGLVRRRWIAVSLGFAGLIAGFWLCYRYEIVTTVVNRISMMLSPWDNVARGGEHIAHAFWALTTGGLFGQGLGEGSPLSIPAAHTDMILAVIGEELGFLGLVAVLTLYVLLIQRGLVISLRAKAPFSFFLGMGIVLATALQLLLITGGMLGVIPLSGVVSPLLSYGMTSTVMTLLFMGVLFSISAHPGTREQRAAQQKRFGRPVTTLSLVLVALLGGLALRAAYIQIWHGDDWLLKPSLVIRADGSRSFVYNPRVLYARSLIPRGTIYDRNGLPLATSDPDEIADQAPALQELGVDTEPLLTSRNERLYPLGGTTFYLLGNINVRALWPSNGLYAEDSLLSHLRGYNNHPQTLTIDTLRVTRYDYTELLPLVHDGVKSRASQRLLAKDRDVYLTIDARLQKRVADVIRD
ncbi:MAG TPA: FtsW/RodA/SpoVE family cell cycle protein, partial [Rhodothermales bacterium]|nr:FtsW/RodA/SpoVE family cell cycle protein [Rhodothermales bacterium]